MRIPLRSRILSASRLQARNAITDWNRRKWAIVPRCGAKRKIDGEPCRQLAMKNGRCVYHGGRTPKGDKWHKTRWPKRAGTDGGETKLRRKLKSIERAETRRQARLAAMSPEQRATYKKWLAAHKPGKAGGRAASRFKRDNAVDLRPFLDEIMRGDATVEAKHRHDIFG